MATKRILSGAHVEIEINLPWVDGRDVEKYAKRLESEAEDVKSFVRDHKSMDINDVYVVREYEYQCEFCKTTFDHDEEKPECCEKAIREWATTDELEIWGFSLTERMPI